MDECFHFSPEYGIGFHAGMSATEDTAWPGFGSGPGSCDGVVKLLVGEDGGEFGVRGADFRLPLKGE